jgi:hypothetical protein
VATGHDARRELLEETSQDLRRRSEKSSAPPWSVRQQTVAPARSCVRFKRAGEHDRCAEVKSVEPEFAEIYRAEKIVKRVA